MKGIFIAIALALALSGLPADAAHTQARLVLSASAAKPGEAIMAGVHLQMDPEWHTYWKNPGASGIPTEVKWTLPAGVEAGGILWPAPRKLPPDDLVTYAYEKEVVLLVPIQLPPNAAPGELRLEADVSWLECKEQCIPGNAKIAASLKVGDASEPSPDAALIETWRQRIPPAAPGAVTARWEKAKSDKLRPIVLEWTAASSENADFFPFAFDDFEVQGAVERLPSEAGKVRIRKEVKRFEGGWPKELSGLLVHGDPASPTAVEAAFAIEDGAGAGAQAASSSSAPSLWTVLLYAFLGGLILNIMPCVLPVIALKILGFVSEARSDPRHVRKLGIIYGVGVLCSFLALAGLVIAVTAAGQQAGWGMQFGNAPFLVGLTVLITLVALSLFGVFEINLGGRVMGSAGELASKQGSAGAFFNGVLATILATPCTAPFLGLALGFAFVQPPAIIALVFLTIGLGLAFPYVLLSFQPAWLRFVPKPGKWMERFKIAMGFPMLATAVWLFSVAESHYGPGAWWLAMFLVLVGCAAWVYGEFVQRGQRRRLLGAAAALLLLAFGYAFVLESQLNWRKPEGAGIQTIHARAGGIAWQPWSEEAVAQAQAEGRPVLVDFTAKWCLTCQANKKFAIEIPSVQAKLKEINAAAFMGDYTHFPPEITAELRRHQRAGVPLVLVYPGTAGAAPEVLPEALTPARVLKALDAVDPKKS